MLSSIRIILVGCAGVTVSALHANNGHFLATAEENTVTGHDDSVTNPTTLSEETPYAEDQAINQRGQDSVKSWLKQQVPQGRKGWGKFICVALLTAALSLIVFLPLFFASLPNPILFASLSDPNIANSEDWGADRKTTNPIVIVMCFMAIWAVTLIVGWCFIGPRLHIILRIVIINIILLFFYLYVLENALLSEEKARVFAEARNGNQAAQAGIAVCFLTAFVIATLGLCLFILAALESLKETSTE